MSNLFVLSPQMDFFPVMLISVRQLSSHFPFSSLQNFLFHTMVGLDRQEDLDSNPSLTASNSAFWGGFLHQSASPWLYPWHARNIASASPWNCCEDETEQNIWNNIPTLPSSKNVLSSLPIYQILQIWLNFYPKPHLYHKTIKRLSSEHQHHIV